VEAFLSMLATERKVSASTHNQAPSAVLFLYREVLNIDLPWLNNIHRPAHKRRIPSVLTKNEVAGVLAHMEGPTALLARLLYGTGMRLMEGMRLRIKDVDFDRHVIVVPMIYTHVLKVAAGGTASPLDGLAAMANSP
jgi:site-specific recombinase XerD